MAAVLLAPRTILRLFDGLRPGGSGIGNRDFWAFGPIDGRWRPYYNKLARDLSNQGRFGFAWDDGLGTPLGARIYSNWVTYRLLHLLGTRWHCAVGLLLLIATSATAIWIRIGPIPALITGVVLAGSPLCAFCYTHLGKPELFWWFSALVFVLLGFLAPPWTAGLFWSAVAMVNLAVSVMLALLAGPAIATSHLSLEHWAGLAAGVAPGVLKHVWRAWHMHRDRQLTSIVAEQVGLWRKGMAFDLPEWILLSPLAVSLLLSSAQSGAWLPGGLLLGCGLGLWWINWRLIYMNDVQRCSYQTSMNRCEPRLWRSSSIWRQV